MADETRRTVRPKRAFDPNGPDWFLCPWCRLWTPADDGCADARPEACSPCWVALERGETPIPQPEHCKRMTTPDLTWEDSDAYPEIFKEDYWCVELLTYTLYIDRDTQAGTTWI